MARKEPRVRQDKPMEMRVKQILRGSFRGSPASLTDGVLYEGLTLRQRLTRDKELWLQDRKAHPMGGPYYAELRKKYGGREAVEALLQARLGQEISQRLWDAMVAAQNKQKPVRSRLLHYMSTVQAVSQGEFIGLLKYMLGLNAKLPEHMHACKELLGMIARLSLRMLYEEEFFIASPRVHDIMA